jgi:hypothetical protein
LVYSKGVSSDIDVRECKYAQVARGKRRIFREYRGISKCTGRGGVHTRSGKLVV